MGYFVSFVCGLAISFVLVFSIAFFFSGESSDKSEPRKDPSDI